MLTDRTIDLLLHDRVRFGAGTIADLPGLIRELGGPAARAFIVSDPGVVASGVTATVAGILATAGVANGLFGAVEPNPGTTVVKRAGAALRASGTDGAIVVPVGGGSSMDTAKARELALVGIASVPPRHGTPSRLLPRRRSTASPG